MENTANNKSARFRLVIKSEFSCSNIIQIDEKGVGTSVVGRANGDQIDSVWGRKEFTINVEMDRIKLKVAVDSILANPSIDPGVMDDSYRFILTIDNKKVLDTYDQGSFLGDILMVLFPYVERPENGQCDFFNLYKSVYDKYSQTVVQDIRSDTGNNWGHIHFVRQLSRHLQLEPVDKGFDSMQIRFWFDHSLAYKKQLIVLELRNKEWRGKLYEIRVADNGMSNYDFIRNFTKKEVKPQSGWEKLIGELEQLKIRDLSGEHPGGADGTTFSVEILTRDSYTYYDFWEPEYMKGDNWKAANMAKIIALLQQEFKFARF